ncbi:hypothetical protein F5I97DRAFT_1887678 [Phlebopus sp. FC_14]|nr:hypothetical protein F5I97DRAFT_1887678 [Phlebopus sp. FC_14]
MSNTSSTVYDRQSIYPTIGKERHLGPSPAPIHDGTTDDYVSVRYDHSACGDPTPSESDPLIGTKKLSAIDRSRIFVRDHKTILSVIVVAFLIFNVFNHFTRCPLYPEVRDQIRKDWDKETLDHKFWKKLRDYDIEEHNKVIIEWQHDEKRHEEEVQRRRAREDKEHEERRKAWQEEIEDILTQQERMRQKWREEQQQQHRLEWEKEVARHRHAVEQRQRLEEEQRETQRRRWQRETEDHDRLEEERRKREDEERQKLNMFWSQAEAHQCTTYGTREYTARLMNLPVEWEHRVEACKATPIVIHGVSYLPTACEDRVSSSSHCS